ncbi:glycoside hydrolase family 31 protein [Streptomyces fulvorobeus]|uniref:Alpha-glucosidase n=1 Tax=Streptomyces fulvorobeus TaxID=284028 RepID=A0A7J0C2F9_9ACTN|nr:glycoside hydrolase family 31 protein [Streptomyces fulvorobeus]NYE39664.1 alpha-glucosidase [Streptomyces fulvorobeus]GFM95906.1 glycosyl hydrolase [Streptomyces fulvorobeus]
MDGHDLVRSVRMVGSVQGLRTARTAWRHRRADARALPPRGAERARVPGLLAGAEPGPGGGVVRFARSELRIRVAAGGAVFWSWDGAAALPSYALPGSEPEADPRAALEPDKDGGWQVVSARLTVAVSRLGAVELRTPGGLVLRRVSPPRWWEPVAGGAARWVQRSEVPADAQVFGLGGRASGARLREGTYRLWNPGSGDEPRGRAIPLHLVVSDAGTHLFFHDNTWAGRVSLGEGEEGAGSGHDRPGTCEVRMDGGPLRCWVVAGTPARVLRGWTALTGAPALPPSWALGVQHDGPGPCGGEADVRRVVAGYRERGLPLSALHLATGRDGAPRVSVDRERFPDLPRLARELREDGVRLVAAVGPAVPAAPGDAVFEGGGRVGAAGAYVRDAGGRVVRGAGRPGAWVCPDFTDPLVREWWGALYGDLLEQGLAGVWHEPGAPAGGREPALPLSARYALEGRGGDHREAHNVYALAMARAGYEGLERLRPDERPFLVSDAAWAGVQRYGGVRSGAGTAGWPGLRASLALVLGLGLSGVPYAGVDMGGARESDELYVRRLQLGAFLPLFRVGAPPGPGGREPWKAGPRVLGYAKAALDGRERLRPYFVTLAHVARLTGAPYVRPLWWGASGDRTLRDCEDAFLLGDALLVAPVLDRGAERRVVRLPPGCWFDTATGEAYEGPGQVTVDASLSRIPVLARAGAVIPVRGADGGLELEIWAPPPGRTGEGLVVRDAGDGWTRAAVERYTSRMAGGRVVVERDGGDEGAAVPPVRVRGLRG